ncbi:MAG: FAD-dependent monooxygenase, partial [Pseudomonadota bacterium]
IWRLFRVPLDAAALQRWGAPYLHIHRADYIAVLAKALRQADPETLRLGAEVRDYRQTETSVTVRLADGSTFSGDVLIGADGIHSIIRTQMLGPEAPRFTGNVAWRVVVPVDQLGEHAPDPTACVWMGKRRHGVTYRLRRGTLANFVGVVKRTDWTSEAWTERGNKADALADFAGWHPTIQTLLEAGSEFYRWALFDRPPLPRWVDGSAALLGDAAHPMLPFMAQGAAMAVEDGWVLARALSSELTMAQGLNRYQAARLDRTAKVQAVSRDNATTFHKSTPLSQLATYGPMWLAGRFAPALIRQRQDWLYGYDVCAF